MIECELQLETDRNGKRIFFKNQPDMQSNSIYYLPFVFIEVKYALKISVIKTIFFYFKLKLAE